MRMTTDPDIRHASAISSGRFQLFALLLALVAALVLTACGPSGSGGGGGGGGNNGGGAPPPEPDPESTLSPRIFILGSEIDVDGKLHIYVNGVDATGDAITLQDFQALSEVTVDNELRLANGAPVGIGGVTVQQLVDGSPISTAFLTDYSASIDLITQQQMVLIFEAVADALPVGFEGQVMNFSDTAVLEQDWTDNLQALRDALQLDPDIDRNNTAFYDGMSETLYRDNPAGLGGLPVGDGLTERCRAARLLISYTDGLDTASFYFNFDADQNDTSDQRADLINELDVRRIVPIMFGSGEASKAELDAFAGSRGAFIFAPSTDDYPVDLIGWIESLGNIVEFVIDAGTFEQIEPGAVNIAIEIDAAEELAPYEVDCLP